ncbi:malto-oligosyltrehalose synthase [Curtobacterium sp. Leaf261]|uniref:malto-oligosyltrehalose synthase n=1 Tax=Curtobacterium sp. Leaf261 TaxID=1736311 RepID=UPI0009EA0360|nr:malto-oligosyltrehalose synthase [Curtobacterium sp. Leaf261]
MNRHGGAHRVPTSTYRLQVRADFDLSAARDVVDYVAALGADWLYLSPVLQAETGSDHGYDVVDHGRVDDSRGGDEAFRALTLAAHSAGLGVLVDIVPNHMGVADPSTNAWWNDLLTNGRGSALADAFDVDWEAASGRIRIPVLDYDMTPGSGEDGFDSIELVDDHLMVGSTPYPTAPGTVHAGDDVRTVHDRQHYEFVHWRRADRELNYRRFFAVNTLAAIRVEAPEVFTASHALVGEWFRDGLVDGLRIDHPDGLYDPAGYLSDLAELTDHAYTLVEKILEPGEQLPASWPVDGTTGYDALGLVDRLFVDPAGAEALGSLDSRLRGESDPFSWHALINGTRRGIADGILGSEVQRLARILGPDVPDVRRPALVEALAEITATFDVYRTYLPEADHWLVDALEEACRTRPELAPVIDRIAPFLADPDHAAAVRLQQTTGMVMAKGVEDTAFYRYSRLTSLNEVGADPSAFAVTPAGFHEAQQVRLASWPNTMTTMTTHDTKRSEDTRARITVLSELGAEWTAAFERLDALAPIGDGVFANLLWQAIVGSRPASRERLHAYAEKASREAGNSTTWTAPDEVFEERMHALVDAVFDDPRVVAELDRIDGLIDTAGWTNGLAMKLVQLTAPGVPDVYQGTELWDRSLVDPDNRRSVDFTERRRLLASVQNGALPPVDASGAAKLLVTAAALHLRRDRPELFPRYVPVSASGPTADHVVAFDRGGAVTAVTRMPIGLEQSGGWAETMIHPVPAERVDVLTGRRFPAGRGIRVADLFRTYPVALLAPAEATPDEPGAVARSVSSASSPSGTSTGTQAGSTAGTPDGSAAAVGDGSAAAEAAEIDILEGHA